MLTHDTGILRSRSLDTLLIGILITLPTLRGTASAQSSIPRCGTAAQRPITPGITTARPPLSPRATTARPPVLPSATAAHSPALGAGSSAWVPVLPTAAAVQVPVLVKDIFSGAHPSRPANMVTTNGRAYFVADDGVHGRELWTTDGTAAGTRLVLDIMPQLGTRWGSDPDELTVVGDKLFFSADIPNPGRTATYGRELAVLDLRTNQVTLLDLTFGTGPSAPRDLIAYRGRCYFSANGNLNRPTRVQTGVELWSSDGTVAGTTVTHEFVSGTASGLMIGSLVLFQDHLYCFAGWPGISRVDLWKYDGTTATNITGPNQGPTFINPTYLTPTADRLFFTAKDQTAGIELYVSDGTAAGTTLLDLYTGGYSSSPAPNWSAFGSTPRQFLVVGRLIYFGTFGLSSSLVINGSNRGGVWVSDGTLAGTLGLDSVALPIGGGGQCIPLGEKVLFHAIKSNVATLYTTDGSRANTVAVAPGRMYFNAAVGSRHAYFSHNDTTHGIELWRTDGTAAGTTLVADLEPNGGSEPMPLAVLNGKLLFQATTAATGAELYAVDLDAHSYPAGRGCGGASIPALSATDPVLGQTMEFRARSAPSSRAGLLAIGLFGTTEQLLDNCAVILDLSLPLITFGFATDSSGLAKLVVPLPNDPGLANLALPMQAVFGPTTTGPLSMDFSNGLVLHPGVQ